MVGSMIFMALAVSSARRPYSSMVLCPSCHVPSISLPRHHVFMLCGSLYPWLILKSLYLVLPGWLQYSKILQASAIPLVPKFTAIITSDPTFLVHLVNSFKPTLFSSMLFQASSRRLGRSFKGPTLSSQLKLDTKLPPGYRIIGTLSSRIKSLTSSRKPCSSAVGCSGE